MPRYDFRCPQGHVTEAIFPMASVPEEIVCGHCGYDDVLVGEEGATRTYLATARAMAQRVFSPPAAIHFHGPGFYATDVKGTLHRKRRKNPGDDLHKDHQPDTAAIASAI